MFWYSIAIPCVTISNILFFVLDGNTCVGSNSKSCQVYNKFIEKMGINGYSYLDDSKLLLTLKYNQSNKDLPEDEWRQKVLFYSHIVPVVVLGCEFLMNKTYINKRASIYSFFWIVTFLIISVLIQKNNHVAPYINNLNWFCNLNRSYLYNNNDPQQLIS